MATSVKDLLQTYKEKRDFANTPEPSGDKTHKPGCRYVVQKHDASSLHYDFRLELDGVLKSWAVTKGPSLNPADKRLAVQTEDHPLGYETFEGVIPDGYGAGTVMLWDQGTWEPQGDDPQADLENGQLKIVLHGDRLKGGWALILMKNRSGKDKKNWLLIKERDDEAVEDEDVLEHYTDSVQTGRSLKEIAKGADGAARPDFVEPQLATLEDAPPEGDEWLHEIKYDGYRLQARKAGETVQLTTRNGKNWTAKYPEIAEAVRQLKAETLTIDGELVALDEEGRSRFERLQDNDDPDRRLAYYAFDLLHLDGKDYRKTPLTDRKAVLEKLLRKAPDRLQYSDHIEGHGRDVIGRACAMNLEGLISKKRNAPYKSGRGRGWIKSKCLGRDEFVIAGYRKSDKKGRPFASLLLGEYVEDELRYRGRVGTGFDEAGMADLAKKMSPLERKTSPLAETPKDARAGAVWLTPRLVAQIGYTERTKSGALRHPSFLGLREDKSAEEVTMPTRGDSDATICGVRITHPDRVVFPRQNVTKRQVAEYLAETADHLLPFLKDRPVSLVRCPSGRDDQCFFQKHHGASIPEEIGSVNIKEKDGEEKDYLVLNTRAALVATAQIGALELHGWGARTDRLERPDRLVIDLDPDEGLGFDAVRDAAREIRDVLESAGLTAFPLLTGGKGIHVVVPLERRRGWTDIKAAAKGLATQLEKAAPDRYVATASKSRRKGKIFIDWLRNERGATAIVPFSLRAHPGAPVATPISWDELSRIESAAHYTIENIRTRLSRLKNDPWDGYNGVRQSISQEVLDVLTDS